jgi:4'-phosphopantetheinyl transferase
MLPFRTARSFGIPVPTAHSVDVWTIALDRPAYVISALEGVLDSSERARARRLWEGRLRSRFIVAHAAARHILAQYLGTSPAAVQFDRLPSERPCVRGGALAFSLSRSGELAVLAVSCGGRIGVDVEIVKPVSNADRLVTEMFCPAEARQYASFPAADRAAAWFSGWTRKAAFLKASGDRTERPHNSFAVDLSPAAIAPRVNAGPGTPWFLRSFSPASGHAAAVAADFPIQVLNRLEWLGPVDTIELASTRDVHERLAIPVEAALS